MEPLIRLACPDDAPRIQEIYAPIVRDTIISFELEPPTVEEMGERIRATLVTHPWLVSQTEDGVVGYAYATHHRARAAYQWAVDVSVYVDAAHRRAGMGRELYRALLAALPLQGFHAAYAGIALPNPASVGVHEALGFVPVGIYSRVGYKLGAWHDVGWWQRDLLPRGGEPRPPVTLAEVRDTPEFRVALGA